MVAHESKQDAFFRLNPETEELIIHEGGTGPIVPDKTTVEKLGPDGKVQIQEEDD